MKEIQIIVLMIFSLIAASERLNAQVLNNSEYPLGEPGLKLSFSHNSSKLTESVVRKIDLIFGAIEENNGVIYQWLRLNAEKVNEENFVIWILSSNYPSEDLENAQKEITRYILSKPGENHLEFLNETKGTPILPNTGAWKYLFPRTENGNDPIISSQKKVEYLGHIYKLNSKIQSDIPSHPKETHKIRLSPELLIGVPHNSKIKIDKRRYDESDYDYVELEKTNYTEMIENGLNVFRVNKKQAEWIKNENVYYWGIGGKDVLYPECLYTSNYFGPALFFDEPMVVTRDHHIKPRFLKDPKYRKEINPKSFLDEFEKVYHEKKYDQGPIRLMSELDLRDDVDIGNMIFLQENMYTWETMVSSAYYQLSEGDNNTPNAIVFEPPGRFGSKRVIPELNMSFGCQIPPDNPKNLISIITGFLRGAARLTNKEWGISIYGQVDKNEAAWFLTHAYNLGATRFFYWDSYQLAAVPYREYLRLSNLLAAHSKNHPKRNLERLKRAANIAIVLPEGYNLGHVKMGIGNFAGLPELNMERKNEFGVMYRQIMHNFLIEIERCLRLGIEFDLFWNVEDLNLNEYKEIVTIEKNGNLSISIDGNNKILKSPRYPQRPEGINPEITVNYGMRKVKDGYLVEAEASVTESSSPIYYTMGADKRGIYNNQYVLWELYGPEEEDYTDFWNERWNAIIEEDSTSAITKINFLLKKPGNYRLRVSTTDLVGRSSVIWKDLIIQ